MITRERIELRISHLNDALTGKCQPAYKTWANENIELCTLALQALDMQPRPIAEAPKDGTFIYGHHTVWDCWICVAWSNFSWVEKTKTTRWPPDAVDLFIPISAPPKVQP
jgi:hypothetical protein